MAETRYVGKPATRVDGLEKVLGTAGGLEALDLEDIADMIIAAPAGTAAAADNLGGGRNFQPGADPPDALPDGLDDA